MKKYQTFYAVVFLVGLFLFAGYNIYMEADILYTELTAIEMPQSSQDLKTYIKAVDDVLTQNIVGGHMWNEVYGTVYKALGKHEENNFTYVNDKDGFLYAGNFWNTSNVDALELALRVKRMQDDVASKGTKVVVIMYPTKYNEEWSDGYYGVPYNDLNDYADSVLRFMRRYNVDYIDFRDVFNEANMKMDDIFYKTDHHWTIPTAFYANTVIIDYLNEQYDAGLDPDGYYRNINNYTSESYADIYLGSQGRDAGAVYAGYDDYTYIYPKFETSYKYEFTYRTKEKGLKEGDILTTLINRKYLDYTDPYEREMNNGYLQGICLIDRIDNVMNQDGPSMMFIRDSYISPVAVFMSPMCDRISMMWSIHCAPGSIEKAVASEQFDYIFVALAIDNLTNEGFPFYIEEENVVNEGGTD